MAEFSGKGIESVNITISATDTFTPVTTTFVEEYKNCEMAVTSFSSVLGPATAAAKEQTEQVKEHTKAFQMGPMKMARFGMSTMRLTSAFKDLGISEEQASTGAYLLFYQLSSGITTGTGLLIALGLVVTVIAKLTSKSRDAREEYEKLVDSMLSRMERLGAGSETGLLALAKAHEDNEEAIKKHKKEAGELVDKLKETSSLNLFGTSDRAAARLSEELVRVGKESDALFNRSSLVDSTAAIAEATVGISDAGKSINETHGALLEKISIANEEYEKQLEIRKKIEKAREGGSEAEEAAIKLAKERADALKKIIAELKKEMQAVQASRDRASGFYKEEIKSQTATLAIARDRAKAEGDMAGAIGATKDIRDQEILAARAVYQKRKEYARLHVEDVSQRAGEIAAAHLALSAKLIDIEARTASDQKDIWDDYDAARKEALEDRMDEYKDSMEARIEEAKTEVEAYQEQWMLAAKTISQATQMLGVAIAETAAGATDSWRKFVVAFVQMMADAFAKYMMMIAAAALLEQDYTKAARAIAAATAVQTLAGGFAAYIREQQRQADRARRERERERKEQERERNRQTGSSPDIWSSGPWDAPSGSAAQLSSSPMSVTIEQNISGNTSPETAAAWKEDAQQWLDDQMPKWERRRRMVGAE